VLNIGICAHRRIWILQSSDNHDNSSQADLASSLDSYTFENKANDESNYNDNSCYIAIVALCEDQQDKTSPSVPTPSQSKTSSSGTMRKGVTRRVQAQTQTKHAPVKNRTTTLLLYGSEIEVAVEMYCARTESDVARTWLSVAEGVVTLLAERKGTR